jgi:hypothetical protein
MLAFAVPKAKAMAKTMTVQPRLMEIPHLQSRVTLQLASPPDNDGIMLRHLGLRRTDHAVVQEKIRDKQKVIFGFTRPTPPSSAVNQR